MSELNNTNNEINEDVNTISNNNDIATEETNNKKISPNDYKVIRDMIKEMDDWNKMLYDESMSILHNNYGLSDSILISIGMMNEEKIKSLSIEEIKSIFEDNADTRYKDNIPNIDNIDDGIKYLLDVKEIQTNIYNATMEASKLKNESEGILNEYLNYLTSEDVFEARRKRLENMKSLAEQEVDPIKKANMNMMIKSMEMSATFEFIFKRFNKDSQREIDSIMRGFFNESKGSYIIERFRKRITKFGFDYRIYKYFYNLEENFLEEKYHVFNNLFLFYYMKFVGYADPYDKNQKLYVQSFTSAIANLVYHKFPNTENEKNFIDIIKKFDDYFMDKYEYFNLNNTTHPNHPVRIESSKKAEADRKIALISKMNELGITGYDSSQTANELQEYMNTELDRIIAENTKKNVSNNDKSEIEEVEPVDNADIFGTRIETTAEL